MSKDTDAQLRGKMVRRMYRDNLVKSAGADPATVADYAVSTSDEERARDLITDEMVDDDACPVVWLVKGTVTLEADKAKIARYIADNLGGDKVPWDLEGEL